MTMAWLAARDIVPRWFAEAAPQAASLTWMDEHGREFQYGIFGENGVRRGSAWSVYQPTGTTVTRTDTLVLRGLALADPLIIESEMDFLEENQLDEIDVRIVGVHAPVRLRGERQGPMFAFQLSLGGIPVHEFVIDGEAAQSLSDTVRPFTSLAGLSVGQSWTIHVVDPFALIRGTRRRLRAVVVSVIDQEEIRFHGVPRRCYVVEAEGVRAWVDESGRVLLQSVELPAVGRIDIREERFLEDKLKEVSLEVNAHNWSQHTGH